MKADKSMQRRHWLMGGVALAAVVGGGIYAWQATRDMRSNDEAVDAFWALQLQQPDGQMLALQSLRGRPLLVNFWATWCPPCVRELPMLDRFAQAAAPAFVFPRSADRHRWCDADAQPGQYQRRPSLQSAI